MKFAGWYSFLVGLMMIGQWSFFLASGSVPEVKTEPIRLAFHLAAEFTTAILLMIGGIALLKRWSWGKTIYLLGTGTLIYSVIVSPGYFAQQGQWVFVAMFGVLIVLALIGVRQVAHQKTD